MPHQKTESKKIDVPDQPEKKRLIDVRDQAVKAPWGMCPITSNCQAVVVPSHLGMKERIMGAPQVINVNMEVPCIGPRCQWWIPEWESCCVRGIAAIREVAAAIEPSESASSYLNRKINRLLSEIEGLRDRLTESEATK